MDSSTKKLLNGSMIYFVGNALTQLISLLLMRFVTGNITPGEYGFYNLVVTVSNLAIPFATLQIADATFKFVLKSESEDEKKRYFTVCFVVSAASVALIAAAVFVLSLFVEIPERLLVAAYVASYAVCGIYTKVIRSLNRNVVFVTGNLIKTVIFLSLEILLISVFGMGLQALLIANTVSMAVFLVYAECRVHALRYFDICSLRAPVFKQMLKFSVPLMPNAAFWWMTSSMNNVIISARLGMDSNGIYTVSGKFSAVLTMVTGVLNMSWQDTAVADYGNKDFRVFLTRTFNTFMKLIFSVIAVLIPFVAVILPYMVDPSYYDAIPFAPFLLIASGASAMSGFMAQIFTGKGKTQSILITSAFGMVANVCVVALLVGKLGLWAAVLGSLAADAVLFGSRSFFARKEFAKGIEWGSFLLILAMIMGSIYFYLNLSAVANLIWFFVTAVFAIILNRQFMTDIFTLLFDRFFKKQAKEKAE